MAAMTTAPTVGGMKVSFSRAGTRARGAIPAAASKCSMPRPALSSTAVRRGSALPSISRGVSSIARPAVKRAAIKVSASASMSEGAPSAPTLFEKVLESVRKYAGAAVLCAVLTGSSLFTGAKAARAEKLSAAPAASASASVPAKQGPGFIRPAQEVATVAHHDEHHAIDSGDTAWILTSTALVLFMTIPGLSLFYAGLVKKKNVLSVLMHCFAITCLMTIMWTVFGYSMAFSTVGMVEGTTNLASFVGGFDKIFLNGVTVNSVTGTIPELLWFVFQMTFAIITPGLMVGAFVERFKFSAMLAFVALWSTVVYFPVCHAVWAGAGSYFGDMGVLDFAGGIVVHITAGVAALLACIMVGPRKENEMTPHNLPMTVTGTGMLWVGWYGFNAGSAAAAGGAAAMAAVVTQISAATAAFLWMIQDWVETGKPSMLGIATGSIAGLAAITPASGFVGPIGALAIGTVSSFVCRYFSIVLKEKFGYDDSLDVFGVHGVGGFVGTLLVGVFCSEVFGGNMGAVSIAKQFGIQTYAAAATTVYTLVTTYIILKFVDATIGIRIDDKGEEEGLDKADHGEEGYIM
mmetsp:Transcript_72142/g.227645  ORF Transcript_72142/g.227645 Transcript_72142/m.227645 type:complete len:576 (-) Transcript_72142:33-1760(-)|eukprot:CAMPEP_0182867268 /NCGR_PEP_ID=MMETSP0034_2-20130328/8632_1 /TAXON_ID=156128 /ORGANISM="Nephroselmis pyriformis, Strain CCMP717" /LENGTH=575 /DNA_ID=CAMNT_0024999615 /DNA_START=284 /DNA_END=2011 /DNA_ORIENTATION=-